MSEHSWTVNMLKGPKDCLNMHHSILVIFFITFKENNSKNFAILVSETLRLFVNIMTPDDNYSLSVKANL